MILRVATRGLAVGAVLCLLLSSTAYAEQITAADIDAALAASPAGPIFAAVHRYFPEDAKVWREEVAKLAWRESGQIVLPREALELGAQIRRRHAPALKFASDASLRKVMVAQYDLHAVFKDDTDACNRLILGGPRDLSSAELNEMVEQGPNVTAQFAAMHEGQTNPVQHGTPTDAAWQGFYETYRAQGNSEADYDLIIEPKDDPALCSAFLGFLAVLRDGEFEGADTIRALIVPALVGS